MKNKQFIAAAALALGFTAGAQADQTVLVPLALGSGLTQSGSFSDAFALAGTFVDDYIFANAPSFSLDSYTATGISGITFTSVTLMPFMTSDTVALTGTVSATSINESPSAVLPSAMYVLEIQGTAVPGASYTGKITSTATDAPLPSAPVPEPGAWALMLAGLGFTGLLARRRRAR